MPDNAASSVQIRGFAPLLGIDPRVLILGSMPSVASLDRQEYYGKPQNAFWSIMGELFGAGPELEYGERVDKLTAAGIAVWDVLAACVRPGSLDSAIVAGSEEINDFVTLLAQFPQVGHIFFNGRKAEQLFRRVVLPQVQVVRPGLHFISLPSTSPAMAALSRAEKMQRWRAVRDALCGNLAKYPATRAARGAQ